MKGSLSERNYGPSNTSEMRRIMDLPRRLYDLSKGPDLTDEYKTPTGTMRLWPIQSAMLAEAKAANGLFAPVGVGAGKELTTLLLPTAMDSQVAVLLEPPRLIPQKQRLIEEYGKHFQIRKEAINLVAYTQLQGMAHSGLLERIRPDLVVANEGHNLKDKKSVRYDRLFRFLKANPATRFVDLTGTPGSLLDFAHLLALALREGAPVPFAYYDLVAWAEALDANNPGPPGALLKLCEGHDHGELALGRDEDELDRGSGAEANRRTNAARAARGNFRCRLINTRGVVATEEKALGTGLVIQALCPTPSQEIQEALARLRQDWEIGEIEVASALEFYRFIYQVPCGMYLKWQWPEGQVDYEWLEARRAWVAEVRNKLSRARREGFDSPGLLERAARDGTWVSAAWPDWLRVSERPEPPTVPVWISTWFVDQVVAWGKKEKEGIIWVAHPELGQAIATAGGFRYWEPGTDFRREDAKGISVMSISSFGTGTDGMQFGWSKMLYTMVPNAEQFEQSVGRLHRHGQPAEEVSVDIFLHTKELKAAFDRTCAKAKELEELTRNRKKLNYANRINC